MSRKKKKTKYAKKDTINTTVSFLLTGNKKTPLETRGEFYEKLTTN